MPTVESKRPRNCAAIKKSGAGHRNCNAGIAEAVLCAQFFPFDNFLVWTLTDCMSSISDLTVAQLRTAANLKERIAALQKQLATLLGAPVKVVAPKPVKKKRNMSAAARARIAAAQRERWAKVRAEKKK